MKSPGKKSSSLYAFLAPYLAIGDEAAIKDARKRWRQQYKANWKKQKRQKEKTTELFFSKDEWQVITKAAGKHKRSYTAFIKQAALSYCNKTYLIRDNIEYNQVREALLLVYARLKNIEESNTDTSFVAADLLHIFLAVQQTITQQLQFPQTLEEAIIAAIQENPAYKETIRHILQNFPQ